MRFYGLMFSLIMLVVLAPLATAVANDCDCVHGDGAGAALGAVPCCSIWQHCCYEHGLEDSDASVVADISRHDRINPKENVSAATYHLLPAGAAHAVLEYHLIGDPEPFRWQLLERSWRQIWLI